MREEVGHRDTSAYEKEVTKVRNTYRYDAGVTDCLESWDGKDGWYEGKGSQ